MMTLIENEWRYFDESFGIPYPWFTKPCLEFLETLDLNGKRIWEYGVGDSTAWFRAKGAQVYGVDSNLEYATKAGAKFTIWNEEYINAIEGFGPFDIVVIDGDWRDECVEPALRNIKPGGYLIIDNWEQPSVDPNSWRNAYRLLPAKYVKICIEENHEDWKTLVVKI